MQEQYKVEFEEQVDDELYRIVESLPEDVLESLRGCVDNLQDKTRDLVDGFYFQERAVKDLADAVGLTVTAAKVTLHRARNAISKCMRRKGHAND